MTSKKSPDDQSPDLTAEDLDAALRDFANQGFTDTGAVADIAELGEEGQAANDTGDTNAPDAQKERYLRLAAEYDNYRKRTTRELQQAVVRGQGDVIKGLLNSLDDLTRVAHIDPSATDAASVVQGVALVERNIMKALEEYGLEIVNPVDHPFDPNMHEALSTQPTDVAEDDHKVAQVYQLGYLLKGQLLRPARVVVKQHQ